MNFENTKILRDAVDHAGGVTTDMPTFRQPDRTEELRKLFESRILVIDGAMGTMIQSYKLDEADYRGSRFADHAFPQKGNNDLLTLTQPDIISEIHQGFLDSGVDILETNTFNSSSIAMADYGMEEQVYELNYAAARLARGVADAKSAETPDKPRFVAGVIGPTNRTSSISPDVISSSISPGLGRQAERSPVLHNSERSRARAPWVYTSEIAMTITLRG